MNWARGSYWKNWTQQYGAAQNAWNVSFGNRFAAGSGGLIGFGFCEAVQGEWEGNPEHFVKIAWTTAPTQGEAQYQPASRFTVFEHSAIKTARTFAGKTVTLSFQLRAPMVPNGVQGFSIIPIIWRGGMILPTQYRTPFPSISMQLWGGPTFDIYNTVKRCDWTFTLPSMPPGVSTLNSYLGVGFDFPALYGPTMDVGPFQINEGGPAPFEEVPYWREAEDGAIG